MKKETKNEKRNTNIAVLFAMGMATFAGVAWTKLILESKYKDKLKMRDEQLTYLESEFDALEKKYKNTNA